MKQILAAGMETAPLPAMPTTAPAVPALLGGVAALVGDLAAPMPATGHDDQKGADR